MIPISEIDSISKKFQVSAETIEKDYVISWILFCLSKSKIRNKFIFYGGTAIKRMFFEDHRFSEDIDLISSNYYPQDNLLKELEILSQAKEVTNLAMQIDKQSILVFENRFQLSIRYSGYDEIVSVPEQIRIDFRMKMDLFGKNIKKKMITTYSDLKSHEIILPVMNLNTILANKLGMLIDLTRNEPRDLFDIWFLLQRRNEFDFNFNEVCTIFKCKYGFLPTFQLLEPRLNKKSFQKSWESRLVKQVAFLPDIQIVITEISDVLKKLFKL